MKYFVCTALVLLVGERVVCADPPITALDIALDGKQVVLGSQLGIEIRSLPELAVIMKLPTELQHVHDLKFSPDGQILLAAGGSPAESGRVEVWRWQKGEQIRLVKGHDDLVYRVAWSPNGTQWGTSSGDGQCLVISAATGELVARYKGHSRAVLSICYLDDQTIVSVGTDHTIRLWSSAEGLSLRTLDNHLGTVNGVAVRPASTNQTAEVIATISEDRTVRLWQPRIGRLIRFTRLGSVPRSLVWSSDAKKLYVGCNDGRVRTLDAESMEMTDEFDGLVGRIHELALEPVGGRILVAGEMGCRVFSLRAN